MQHLYYRWAVTFRQQIRDGRYNSITHVKDEAVTLWKQHSGMYEKRRAVLEMVRPKANTVAVFDRKGQTQTQNQKLKEVSIIYLGKIVERRIITLL